MVSVDDDMADDHDQGGAQPADQGQGPGEGQGAGARAQVVDGAAHKVTLDNSPYTISKYRAKNSSYEV